jgi:hypothetical protein
MAHQMVYVPNRISWFACSFRFIDDAQLHHG